MRTKALPTRVPSLSLKATEPGKGPSRPYAIILALDQVAPLSVDVLSTLADCP